MPFSYFLSAKFDITIVIRIQQFSIILIFFFERLLYGVTDIVPHLRPCIIFVGPPVSVLLHRKYIENAECRREGTESFVMEINIITQKRWESPLVDLEGSPTAGAKVPTGNPGSTTTAGPQFAFLDIQVALPFYLIQPDYALPWRMREDMALLAFI